MRTPSAAELVRIWELGHGRAPWYGALLLLAPAFPQRTFDDLAALSVGERNVHLMALRARLFGTFVESVVECPRCRVPLEFSFDVLAMCPGAADPEAHRAADFEASFDDVQLLCRPATSADLAALADGAAHAALVKRLVLEAHGPAGPLGVDDLGELAVASVSAGLEEADPFASMRMTFACDACRHEWATPFDIVGYLWNELTAQVQRILDDVERLARAYGWSEGSILAMSGLRRRFYLDRAS
jgi:hypothetical protein